MKPTLLRVLLSSFLAVLPALSHAKDLAPRAEVNFRAGTDRSILMTEFWAPLAQQSDRVLYGDLRLMGDDSDNREGNLGFGYRQISTKTNSVLGVNAWIDRRRTENGNHFHQLTLGLESLGNQIDLRANGYIQLNNSKTRITPNIGSATPYLSGTGIFYDTNGFIVEEPQDGFDAEIGYRLPVLQKYIDATRVYAGFYHFWGDTTDNVTGFRLRTEAQVNSIFSVGARFQHDGPRGSQGFLEATLRFPFKSKKLYQEHGLRSRLDESPERDIDIVTGAKVDTGLMKPIINEASGTQQRILYVDNTNTNSGDGSKDNPFNTLKAAETALQENDILYINRGDGTTNGMDNGIVIDKANIRLIGSGSALTYNGFTLLDSSLAPIITNDLPRDADNNVYTSGSGILVIADNAFISGITISNAQKAGIYASTLKGETFESITIDNVSVFVPNSSNNKYSILISAQQNGTIKNASITNSSANGGNALGFMAISGGTFENIAANNIVTNNSGRGVLLNAGGGKISTANLSNLSLNNGADGIFIQGSDSGSIGTINVENLFATGNSEGGLRLYPITNTTIGSLNISNASVNGNRVGIDLRGLSGSTIDQVTVKNVIANNNSVNGVSLSMTDGAIINSLSVTDVIANNNTQHGFAFSSATGASAGHISLTNATASTNSQSGVVFQVTNSGILGNINIESITATNNLHRGVYMNANSGSINNAALTNINASNNFMQGIYLYALNASANRIELNHIQANGNREYGVHAYTQNATGTIAALSMQNSDVIGNTLGGVYLRRGNVSSVMAVDIGGGAFGSVGQNRIFGNTGNDLLLDRTTISAANNWWNNGGAAPTRVTPTNGGSATYTPPLASDPRP